MAKPLDCGLNVPIGELERDARTEFGRAMQQGTSVDAALASLPSYLRPHLDQASVDAARFRSQAAAMPNPLDGVIRRGYGGCGNRPRRTPSPM